MDVFRIQATLVPLRTIGEILVIAGAVLLVAALLYYLVKVKGREDSGQFSRVFIYIVILMVAGAPMFLLGTSGAPGVVTIQQNQITVSGGHLGNITYTSSNISFAFVENLHSGNITLSSKIIGTKSGNTNEGQFRLSNGATADVLSTNATALVILLHSGLYVILGSNQTALMASDFSANVYHVPGY